MTVEIDCPGGVDASVVIFFSHCSFPLLQLIIVLESCIFVIKLKNKTFTHKEKLRNQNRSYDNPADGKFGNETSDVDDAKIERERDGPIDEMHKGG